MRATVTLSAGSRVGLGRLRCSSRLTPKLDILRLTTRGLERLRRGGNRRAVISRSPSASAVARWSRDSCEAGKLMELRNAER